MRATLTRDDPRAPEEPGGKAGDAGWLLVGPPNVGKSALFGRLTGRYVTVSNYPGTSVEVTRGTLRVGDREIALLDLPGLHGLLAVTEDERVARRAVLAHRGTIVAVLDASHLERQLPLALQLLALGRPMVVACNLMDEARAAGAAPDCALLAERLGVPVVPTVATDGEGIEALLRVALAAVPADGGWAAVRVAGDGDAGGEEARAVAEATVRRRMALALLDGVVPAARDPRRRRDQQFDRWLLAPWSGLLIVAAILYAGFYKFVGGFAAGTVVDWVEKHLFDGAAGRAVAAAVRWALPWAAAQDLVVGPYGLFTLGVRYAVAIVLPIVGAFFLVFALLEDSGYLPRLALLMDRGLKRLGLSGRAVIPLVLGFGCGTMATLVTRTLETRRERLIATLLLALAIPCSAQLGVVLGILSVSPAAVAVWALVLAGVFIVVGWTAARLVPGAPPSLYLELPPLRLPRPRNLAIKTFTRMRWYFAEIFPLFLLASVLLWLGDRSGVLARAVAALEPVVRLAGLPAAATPAFLYGFFRRDFGVAGLYDLAARGALDVPALTTAAIVITLFVPCIAQFLMMKRERGLGTALAVLATATAVAFLVGGLVGRVLRLGGWT